MKITPAKENILKKIRKALSTSVPLPFPQSEGNQSVFLPPTDELEVLFAEAFSTLQGRFVYCAGKEELQQQLALLIRQRNWTEVFCNEPMLQQTLPQIAFSSESIHKADAAVTGCELLIARTGSIVMSSAQPSGRTTSVYAPVHICIARVDQLVYDLRDGIQWLRTKYATKLPSLITWATGPSRTADIEKTLVVGVHGPREVFVFLTEN
ncbi:MAG TPA: LUD domain-containing protein [Agriterribacter sp.]|nr:LUD domain-containing protein [Chitinophagaceae bacterium]HRP32449.1 LUD domain-containing protein [Agriterribacter sp.]